MRWLFTLAAVAILIAYLKGSRETSSTMSKSIEEMTYVLTGRDKTGTFAEYPISNLAIVDTEAEVLSLDEHVFDMPGDEVIR